MSRCGLQKVDLPRGCVQFQCGPSLQASGHMTRYLSQGPQNYLQCDVPICFILWLLLKYIGHHLGDQWFVGFTIEHTYIHKLGNVKEKVLIDESTKHFRRDEVDLRLHVVIEQSL